MSRRLPKKSPSGQRRRVASPPSAAAPLDGGWLGDDQLFTPLGHEPGYDYPLLVWLTGDRLPGGSGPSGQRRFDLGRVMQRVSLRNFIAVAPAAPTDESTALDIHGVIWRSIDLVCRRFAVHPRRIFLVGHGNGGSDAFRIGCRHARDFAGVISLGGPFPLEESLFASLADVRRLPMLLCCRRDAVADAPAHTDRVLRLFHAAGASLAMRIYPEREDLSRTVLADVNRWVMDEVCGTPAAEHSLSAS
jgi:phospholipase/carboxylesterase